MQNEKIKQNPWIFFADKDLMSAELLSTNAELTGEVAFLCQQAIEKYLKAVLFELKIPIQKTHNLLKLYKELKELKGWELDGTSHVTRQMLPYWKVKHYRVLKKPKCFWNLHRA
jgi:HEPN domain-containing protein